MRAMEHTLEVDIEDARPDLWRQVGEILLGNAEPAHAAGRIDQGIDVAVAGEQPFDYGVDARAIGGVKLVSLCATCADLTGDPLRKLKLDVGHRHGPAARGERAR